MHDEPDPELAFDLAALQAQLQRKSLKGNCPFCGENRWGVPAGKSSLLGVIRPDGTVDPEVGLQFLTLVCTNCGFMRLHSTEQLEG